MSRSTAAAAVTIALLAGGGIGWQLAGSPNTRTVHTAGPATTVTATTAASGPSSADGPGLPTTSSGPPAIHPAPRQGDGPRIVVSGPRRFSGTGRKRIGTLDVRRQSVLRWTNSRGLFRILFNGTGEAVHSTARSGRLDVPGGIFRGVQGRGARWTIQLTPRPREATR